MDQDHQLPDLGEYTPPVTSEPAHITPIEVTLTSLCVLVTGWVALLVVWAAHVVVVALQIILGSGAIVAVAWATGLAVLASKYSPSKSR